MISKFSSDTPYVDERPKTPLLVRAGIYAGAALLGRQVLRSQYVRPLVGELATTVSARLPELSHAHRFLLEGYEQYFRYLADENLLWKTPIGAVPKFGAFTPENMASARRVFADAKAVSRSTLEDNIANATALGDMLRGVGGVVRDVGDMAKDISPWGIAETRTGMQPTSFGVDYHQSNANLITPQYIAQAKEAWPQLSNKYATGCADCGTLKIQNER